MMNLRRTLGWIAPLAMILWILVPAPCDAATATQPITVPFDHLTTGWELDGVHRDLPCESCHLNAIFKGTPQDCGTCHITGSPYNATPKTATHIPTTNYCVACHNTISFRPDVHFDHAQVLGSCISCHNGTVAQGEGPNHPATSRNCEACHTMISWSPAKAVDHTQIPLAVSGFCIICHNGVQAAGKSKGHVATNLECGDCHLTTTWVGANFDHTGITSGCVSCHNGTKAVGKQGNHMPTTNLCEHCHTTGLGTKTPSWVPSLFNHLQMSVSTCQSCHSGTVKISTGVVPGQPTNHVPPIPAGVDCGVCHGNNPSAETWAVLAASIPTLHSGLSVGNCVLCHAGETFAGVPAPYIPMSISGISPTKKTPLAPLHIPILAGTDCSACHGAAYQAGGFGPATAMSAAKHAFVSGTCDTCHDTGKSFYVGSGTPLQLRPANHVTSADARLATSDCSVCHETKDWLSTMLPTGHMPNPGNLTCVQCHASAPADFTPATLAAIPALHTGISGNCGLCHGNYTSALTWFNGFTPKDGLLTPAHIPYRLGTDCSSCHAANYVAGGFGPTTMSAAKHAFVPTACDTCHETGLSFYMGASTPALQGRPTNHMSPIGTPQEQTGDCSGCHTTTDWTANVIPAGHMPNPANQGCSVCHTAAPTSYTTLAANATLHTGITSSECTQCHGYTTPLTWYHNFTPKDAVLAPAHIPILAGTSCGSCHSSTTYAVGGFGPMNMTQATHSFVATTCITCHEKGLSFYMGAASPALQGRPADHTSGQMVAPNDCSVCHTTANWNSTAMPAGHMPNPANQGCSVCHTAAPANYLTLAPNATLHTGITSGCITCHGAPNAAPPVFYLNYTPKDAVLSPVHIPTGSTPCEDCHAISFTSFSGTTMTAAKHTLMFASIGGTCDACHDLSTLTFYGVTNLTTRPNGHHVGRDCSSCHNPNNWGGDAAKKKAVAQTAARSTIATVVSAPAVAASAAGTAQSATVHLGAARSVGVGVGAAQRLSHAGVTGNCHSCHNGVLATGKGAMHIASNNACQNCHTTIAWLPALFDHQGVTASCASCHNGVLAPGKPMLHVATKQDCSACHGTITWAAATFSHLGVNAPCQSCHNGITAIGKQIQHVATTQDCGTCHNTLNWTSVNTPAPPAPNKPAPNKPVAQLPAVPNPRGTTSGPTK